MVHEGPVLPDAAAIDRQASAGRPDGRGPHVVENACERSFRAEAATFRRDVDPGDRLAVEIAVAHRPVEQVLEAARQVAGVLWRREQHGSRFGELPAQPGDRRMEGLVLLVRIEGGELREPVIEDGSDAVGGLVARAAQCCGVDEPVRVLPVTSRIRRSEVIAVASRVARRPHLGQP